MVAISLSVYVFVVYTVTREIEVEERLLDELLRVVEETTVEEEVAVAQVGAEPWPTTNGWTSTTLKSIQDVERKKLFLWCVSKNTRTIEASEYSQLVRQNLSIT